MALARPRSALALREIEPKLPSSWVSRSAPHFSDNKKGLPIRKSFLLSKRARDGCHKVQWTLVLARPRGALASREIEPKLPSSWVSRSASHFSDNKKGLPIRKSFFVILESARRVPQGPVDLGSGTTEERFSSPRNRTQTAKQLGFEKCPALLE